MAEKKDTNATPADNEKTSKDPVKKQDGQASDKNTEANKPGDQDPSKKQRPDKDAPGARKRPQARKGGPKKPRKNHGRGRVKKKKRPAKGKPAAARQGKGTKKPGSDDAPTPENPGNLGSVVIRNEFYKDGYRSLLRLAVIQSVIIVGLIAVMFFVVNIHQPENRFFATTEDGRLIPMVPLSQPNLSSPALMSWVAQASVETMTFGFSDYRRRLQESSRNFTKSGWESFTTALERSRIIEMVEQNQQIVTAAPSGAPIIQREGIVQGRYQWTIQVPLVLSFQSGTKKQANEMLVTLIIVRVPRLENPNGIGIEQWIAVAQ